MTINRSKIKKQIENGDSKMMKKKGYKAGGKVSPRKMMAKGMKMGGKVNNLKKAIKKVDAKKATKMKMGGMMMKKKGMNKGGKVKKGK